jgi:hypothetical protein
MRAFWITTLPNRSFAFTISAMPIFAKDDLLPADTSHTLVFHHSLALTLESREQGLHTGLSLNKVNRQSDQITMQGTCLQ